jgi:hypothetical protein
MVLTKSQAASASERVSLSSRSVTANPRSLAVAARVFRLPVAACLVVLASSASAAPSAPSAISTAKDRKEVSITVYNSDFGLVREVRELELPKGRVSLEFRDVASLIQSETVSIKGATPDALRVFEQNYRYDLLSPETLLAKYVGKKIRVYRWNEKLGKDEGFDAEVLSVNGYDPVLKIGGEITYGFPGRLAFPEVPANLIAKPTLVWSLDAAQPKQRVEATYMTRGMSWKSDYVLVLDENDAKADLQGWVTLTNRSGASYENAKLQLVAGDVNRVAQPIMYDMPMAAPTTTAAPAKPAPVFKEEGLFEYHLYTLSQPTDVLQNEQKQVSLMEAKGIGVDKKLIFWGQQYWYRGSYGQVMSNQKVGVYLDIQNKEQNKLGMPLPKGIVRVYKADKSGSKQFVGEDSIDHTPRDEKIRVKMGDAFDVVGDRKQMSWKEFGYCTSESEWEISLRNHKDVPVTVEDVEDVGGDWEVLSETIQHTKKDADTFTFDVKIPAKGETKLKYRVRVRWC